MAIISSRKHWNCSICRPLKSCPISSSKTYQRTYLAVKTSLSSLWMPSGPEVPRERPRWAEASEDYGAVDQDDHAAIKVPIRKLHHAVYSLPFQITLAVGVQSSRSPLFGTVLQQVCEQRHRENHKISLHQTQRQSNWESAAQSIVLNILLRFIAIAKNQFGNYVVQSLL